LPCDARIIARALGKGLIRRDTGLTPRDSESPANGRASALQARGGAIAGGTLGFAEAIDLGVVRLYGPAQDVAAARSWLVDIAPG